MYGRMGMYYPVRRASLDQQGRPIAGTEPKPVAISAPPSGDLGMFLRMTGVIAAVCIAVALVSWSAG